MTWSNIGSDGVFRTVSSLPIVSPQTEDRIRILVNRLRNVLKLVKK